MRFFAVALIFSGAAASYAQAPQVPHKMHFANMTLTIRDEARREIQGDVDALTRHPKYFGAMTERAKLYFPIISRIFAEEKVPDDLKYLVIQESALEADAVSSSNAVGFWQFKDFTAVSVGMRVDRSIDERMNIASASRGAANYLKQNNQQFDNWVLALQAYQMGAGGVKRAVGDKHNGKRHFELTARTYWYIKKFIAYKVAFENSVSGAPLVQASFVEVREKKSLRELAREFGVDETKLKEYNKWALNGIIPDDKTYVVVVPNGNMDMMGPTLSSKTASKATPFSHQKEKLTKEIKFINGLKVIKALEGETIVNLSQRADISLTRFLKYNEMQVDQNLEPGSFYFLERKKKKTTVAMHKVKAGDDLWSISQQYGIQVKKIKNWNGIENGQRLAVGSSIWLIPYKGDQPSIVLPEVPEEEIAALDREAFNWEVKTTAPIPAIPVAPKANDSVASEKLIEPITFSQENGLKKEHIVGKGETLYSIAKMYGVGVIDLTNWNNLPINSGLAIGQKVLLHDPKQDEKLHTMVSPSQAPVASDLIIHEVKESDTLYAIARQYGVTIKDLMEWNDKKELTVKQGEKIRILKK
jgi:membrane-bound lytic murein transglycosylase D